jgi:hypothetical protein
MAPISIDGIEFSGLVHIFQATKANWIEWHNCRDFMDHIGYELNFKSLENFHDIKVESFKYYGGTALFENYFRGSVLEVLQSVYPQFKWLMWKLSHKPPNRYWESEANQRDFMDELGTQIGFKYLDDWYKITWKDLEGTIGASIVKRQNSPLQLLQFVYPRHHWENERFSWRRYWGHVEQI